MNKKKIDIGQKAMAAPEIGGASRGQNGSPSG